MRVTRTIHPWWDQPEGRAHDDLLHLVQTLLGYDRERRHDMAVGMALYGDRHAQKALALEYALTLTPSPLSFNVVRSVGDALQAQIAAQHTLARVLTERGNWSLRKKAQRAEQLIEGVFDANDVHSQAHQGFLDAFKGGLTGFKVYSSAGRIKVDRIAPGEVLVDPVDGKHGDPRRIYQLCYLPRDVVMGEYADAPEARQAIESAPTASARQAFPWEPRDTTLDRLLVVEAWQAADPDDWHDATNGRHVIAVEGATLLDEEWDRGLPFAFWRYERDGFYGRGGADNLRATQREINYTLQKISRCLHLNSGFHIVVDGDDGDVDAVEMTDAPGQVIRVTGGGGQPHVIVSSTVPPEFRAHLEDCIRRGFEQEGVSQLSATSKKPSGLSSGEAIREYNDIESTRFAVKSKSFERFIGVHLASKIIEEARWLADNDELQPVRSRSESRRGVKFLDIRWSDVGLDADDYAVKVSPASELPRLSAGRQGTIDAWLGAGLLQPQQYLQLYRSPDIDAFLAQELAPYELVLDHLEDMIEEGVYTPPETTQDIALSLRLASNAHQRAVADGVPEEHSVLILDYMDALKGYQQDAMQAAQAQQQAMQGPAAPPGAPAGPPPEAGPPLPPN